MTSGIRTLFLRELRAYFISPIGYVFTMAFLGIMGFLFMRGLFGQGVAEMRHFFYILPFALGIYLPILSMRMWAEERRQGTIELLMTFPMRLSELVLGKFLGAWTFYLISLALSLPLAVLVVFVWDGEAGPIAASYLGAALGGAVFIAIGSFFSSLTRDQIVAVICSLVVCMGLMVILGWTWIVPWIDSFVPVPAPGLGTFLAEGWTLMPHFDSIERGVIDLGDIAYFLSYTVLFLLLTYYVLESQVKHHVRGQALLAGVLAFMVTFFLNLNLSMWRLPRFDLTEGARFSVSDASREILAELKAPVEVTFFLSDRERLPTEMQTLERDVTDLLAELRAGSPNLRYKVVDPASTREQEDRYNEQGIRAFEIMVSRETSAEVKLVYHTLQVDYLGKRERIEQVMPRSLATLEYDLMVLIHRMSHESPPHVAVFAPYREVPEWQKMLMQQMGRPVPPAEDPYQMLQRMLRDQGTKVTRIRLNSLETIPEDADVLAAMSPEELHDRQLWEIGRFLRRGKKVLFCVQAHTFSFDLSRRGELIVRPDLHKGTGNALLNAYGVGADERILMDQSLEPIRTQIRSIVADVAVPNQIVVTGESIGKDHATTEPLTALFYLWGSALTLTESKLDALGLKRSVLFRSSEKSWFVEGGDKDLMRRDYDRPEGPFAGPQFLAVDLEGVFPDAFEGKPVPTWPDDEAGTPEPAPPLEPKPGRLVVIGCGQMFSDEVLRIFPVFDNALLFNNLIDSMALGTRLSKIRSKQYRPAVIPRTDLENPWLYHGLGIGMMPFLLLVGGLSLWLVRWRRRRRYAETVGA